MPEPASMITLPECSPDQQPQLSIVVALTNGVEQARRCLESLVIVGAEVADCQTIVVLNDPTADVRDFFERAVTCAEVIDSPTNLGTAAAWQLGFNRARADHVLLLHEDAAARPGAVPELLNAFVDNPDAACVGPLLTDSGDEAPSNAGWLLWREHLETRLRASDIPSRLNARPYPVDVVSSAFSMWDRLAWLEIGGFDERRFPAVGVELDACTALWSLGRSTLVVPTVTCDHETGAMDTRESPLSGTPLRYFLISELRVFWEEKWAQLDADYVSLRERGLPDAPDQLALEAGLANAARRREQAGRTQSGFAQAARPITDPDRTGARPTEVSDVIVRRAALLEEQVVERYRSWLVESYESLSSQLREATEEGARLFHSREAIQAELEWSTAEIERLSAELAARDQTIAELGGGPT